MRVARSGYYRFRTKKDNRIKGNSDMRLLTEVKALHSQSDKSYGSRRISKALQQKGYKVGRYQARTLMRKAKIECKQRRRFKVTTNSNHSMPVAANRLDRAFTVSAPNRVWVADITYLWTQEGWLYLAAVIDLFSRRVVGWSLANHMREELVTQALSMAIDQRCPSNGLLHHSDRGSQYASAHYQNILEKTGVIVSMSRKGNCWDNAVMERFFGSLKTERTDGKFYASHAQAKTDVINYIEFFYNKERLHSTLNYLSPMQYEKNNQSLFN
jgi:putative transposase